MNVTCARVQTNFSVDKEENVTKPSKALRDGWGFFRDRRREACAAVAAP